MADKTIMEELCPVMTKFINDEQMFYNKATQIEKSLHYFKTQKQEHSKRKPIVPAVKSNSVLSSIPPQLF
jgi:hypothetical protein